MRVVRVLLVVLAIILLLALVAALVFGGNKKSNTTQVQATPQTDIATVSDSNATVTFLTQGAINGNDQHRQIQITVSKSSRILTIIQGYQGKVLSTQSFANNQPAFEGFLAAIQNAGFVKERANPTTTNIAGQCPLGVRYIYSSTNIANVPNNLWTSSCDIRKGGTFAGNVSTVNSLFQMQIPNYNSLVSGVQLR